MLSLFITEDTILHEIVSFIGSVEISLIIAIITAIVMFGLRKGKDMDTMMKSFETGLKVLQLLYSLSERVALLRKSF
ncbi:hypothetical protein ABFE51_10750 [Staphylococcus saprophyticus]